MTLLVGVQQQNWRFVAAATAAPTMNLMQTRQFATGRRRKLKKRTVEVEETEAAVEEVVDEGVPIRVNILKEGKDPIELEDKEYPAWLWTIGAQQLSESEMLDKGLSNLTPDELKLSVIVIVIVVDSISVFVITIGSTYDVRCGYSPAKFCLTLLHSACRYIKLRRKRLIKERNDTERK